MRCLVTGGAGFIGSHLVDRLLKEGYEVTVIDDFSEGELFNLPIGNKKMTIYDLSITEDISPYFREVDYVFHLAAKTRPQESIIKPILYNLVNIDGIVNVLNACVKNKIKKLVFVSSSSIYGNQDKFPTSETAPPIIMSPYALTKWTGEQYCKLFERIYGLKSNYIRPFNVFGPRQSPDSEYSAVIPKFISSIKNNLVHNIWGDGKQKRDFIYVDDVVEMLILAATSPVSGEAFNAGCGENISINNLYNIICRLMKKNIIPNHIDPKFEPRLTLAKIDKAKKLLNWKPKVKLEEGIKKILRI